MFQAYNSVPVNGFNQGVMHLLFRHFAWLRSETLEVPELQEYLDGTQ
jgi:hypothetical protein